MQVCCQQATPLAEQCTELMVQRQPLGEMGATAVGDLRAMPANISCSTRVHIGIVSIDGGTSVSGQLPGLRRIHELCLILDMGNCFAACPALQRP